MDHRSPRVVVTDHANWIEAFDTNGDEDTSFSRLNQYKLKEIIGRGSFGYIQKAESLSVDCTDVFALKILSKSRLKRSRYSVYNERGEIVSVTATENALKEINILSQLYHPNIITLKEVIQDLDDDKIVLVTELLEFGPIMRYLSQSATYTAGDYVSMHPDFGKHARDLHCLYVTPYPLLQSFFSDLVMGLSYLHSRGVAHRDIKPENLLISFSGILKICDFNSATQFDKAKNPKGKIRSTAGTPAFWAPEVVAISDGPEIIIPPNCKHYLDVFDDDVGLDINSDDDDDDAAAANDPAASPYTAVEAEINAQAYAEVHGVSTAYSVCHVPSVPPVRYGTYSAYCADSWSVGVTLHCMMFGLLPFWADSPSELFSSIISDQPRGINSNIHRTNNQDEEKHDTITTPPKVFTLRRTTCKLTQRSSMIDFEEMMLGLLEKIPCERWDLTYIYDMILAK